MKLSTHLPNSAILKHAAIVGLGFFILAWGGIELTREAGRTSSIWPANAIALAFLLRCDRREWPALLVGVLFGSVIAHVFQHDSMSRTFFSSALSLMQTAIGAHVLRRYTKENFDFSRYNHLIIFAGVAILLPVPFAMMAAGYFSLVMGLSFIQTSISWYLADAMGLIIFTPLFFMIGWDELRNFTAPHVRKKSVILMTLLAAVLSVVFLQSSYPLLFLVFPVMALSSFWFGTAGAVVAIAATTIMSITCTIHGLGPITLIHGSLAEKTFVLQGFLATSALISLPIASALSYRTYLEKTAQEARFQAETANLAKSKFLTSMSHELRTPLNAIMGFSQLIMMDQSLSAKTKEHVNYVMTGGEHLLKLVGDVLDLAKIEAGVIPIKAESIACGFMLDEVIELLRPLAEKRYIKIEKACDPDIFIMADRSRLTQVMVNLLSNAIKYNRTYGYVTVAAEIINGNVRIKVADSGYGISREMQEKVFEPFNRLGAENSDIEGTGIGLAISKQLTEAMNGNMGFSSVEAEGSIFYIDLPATNAQVKADLIVKDQIPVTLEKSATRILYIEDNLANGELMRNVVQNLLKADIMVVRDGRTGLRKAREFAPDIIISDIHLPDMTGNEILKSLREHPLTSKIPVMALTADATFLDDQKAKAFDRVMSKPFQLNELVENLTGFLPAAA